MHIYISHTIVSLAGTRILNRFTQQKKIRCWLFVDSLAERSQTPWVRFAEFWVSESLDLYCYTLALGWFAYLSYRRSVRALF